MEDFLNVKIENSCLQMFEIQYFKSSPLTALDASHEASDVSEKKV